MISLLQLRFLRFRRKYIKIFKAAVITGTLLALFLCLIYLGYNINASGFNERVGIIVKDNQYYQPARTFWDWLQLLIVPFAVAIGTAAFGWIQSTQERATANDDLQETTLQSYLNHISESLLDKDLRNTDSSREKRQIIRTRTIITLRRLDGLRKSLLLNFLYDSELIGIGEKRIVDLQGVDFRQINLNGATFNLTSLQGANMDESDLQGAQIITSDFTSIFLQNSNLSLSNLGGSIFRNAHLTNSKLYSANMTNSTFDGAYFENTNLKFAICVNTGFFRATLVNSDLREANFEDAVFEEAKLEKANLRNTKCIRTNLRNADLRNADLRNADLREADFEKANLCGANLQGANLTNTNMSDAKYDAKTRFPKQFTPHQNMDYCR